MRGWGGKLLLWHFCRRFENWLNWLETWYRVLTNGDLGGHAFQESQSWPVSQSHLPSRWFNTHAYPHTHTLALFCFWYGKSTTCISGIKCPISCLNHMWWLRAAEIGQWLRASTTLVENLGSGLDPWCRMLTHDHLQLQFQGPWTLF